MNVMLFLGHLYTGGGSGPGVAPSGVSHVAVSVVARGMSGAGSGFRVDWRIAAKVYFLFFKSFPLVLASLLFWRGDWALGYHCIEFRQSSDIF